MSSFFDEIAAKLAQLSGVATPEVSRDELNEFNVRDIQAVTVSEGSGGASPHSLRWSNVATITYAEVLAKAADPCYFDLLTLPTATIIDAFFLNLTEVFDDAGSIDFNLGWLMDTGSPRQLNDGNLLLNFSQDDWAGVMGSGDGFNSSFSSSEVKIGHYGGLVFDADIAGPLQAKFSAIVGDGNTGSLDLWLRTQAPA